MRCASLTQGFYFLVKFGLVLIYSKYPLWFYWEEICSIHYLDFFFFFFEKHIPSQVMRDFSVQNLETTPRIFLSNFFCDIYLSRIVNYSDSVFTLHLTWGAFSLVCVPSVFFFFLSSFFSAVFSLIDTNGL